MAGAGKQYVVGKGKLHFDQFAPGSKIGIGERYLGNSPELSMSRSEDTLDHIDADEGLNVKDESITITNDMTGSFSTDNIDVQNVAMWFGGDIERSTIVAALGVAEPDFLATRGRSYQLGKSADTPQGTRMVTNVKVALVTAGAAPTDPLVTTDLTPAQMAANVDIDLERARVYIESDAPDITDGDLLRVTFDQEGMSREIVIAKGQEIRGSLRFHATNPVGERKDYFWPYVKITANGDYALKGDDWQVMSFNFEVLKKDSRTERVYIEALTTNATV